MSHHTKTTRQQTALAVQKVHFFRSYDYFGKVSRPSDLQGRPNCKVWGQGQRSLKVSSRENRKLVVRNSIAGKEHLENSISSINESKNSITTCRTYRSVGRNNPAVLKSSNQLVSKDYYSLVNYLKSKWWPVLFFHSNAYESPNTKWL